MTPSDYAEQAARMLSAASVFRDDAHEAAGTWAGLCALRDAATCYESAAMLVSASNEGYLLRAEKAERERDEAQAELSSIAFQLDEYADRFYCLGHQETHQNRVGEALCSAAFQVDSARAELARVWDALTEVDAVLRNDRFSNRVENALRIIDDARHSDAPS